jgi:lipopolysaccharide export system permease protein
LKILDLYIIKKFLGTFFFALGLLIVVTIVFDLSEKMDNFIDKGATVKGVIFDYYMNFIPFFANMFTHLIVFIAVIFFTSRMAAKTEFVAIFSSGISSKRLLFPYFIAAALITAFSFILGNYVIPPANEKKLEFEQRYVRRSIPTVTAYNMHCQVLPGLYFYIDYFNKVDGEGVNITLEKFDGVKLISKLSAQKMKWDSTRNLWTLSNYKIRNFSEDDEELIMGVSLDTVFNLFPKDLTSNAKIVETMNASELNKYIEEQKLSGSPEVVASLIEKHSRIASPFATFILTIIGFSLSIKKVRSGGLGLNIGIGLFLSFTYILFMKFSSVFALNAGVSVVFSMWLPNIIYFIIAAGLFFTLPE